eukprot:CAMPEP_0117421122 /NCGR_PEP_ID=MMETSP0758-20121206/2296_1 /TAXON_ID=63605 /ORGANISM="Percolomonas cosmopolitus, Strain AE-1 (ATCC 50343)" /LENGTH=135 /DNA_ID=CAMNT_0005203095 /DNA_START=45 /DNA_END=452 /DNA_ORIENTATION=-
MAMRGYGVKIASSENAPKAVGPYSQATIANNTIYVSGCLGLVPDTGDMAGEEVEVQAKQALENMGAVLEAAGSNFDNVVKTTVLLTDMNDFKRVNEVYSDYFSNHKPARICYAVKDLPLGGKVEIDAIAVPEESM